MSKFKYGVYPPPILPGMEEYAISGTEHNEDSHPLFFNPKPQKIDPFLNQICECCNFTATWQMPIIAPIDDTSILEYEIIGYDRLSNAKSSNYGIHFYCSDPKILSSLHNPQMVYNRINKQPFAIGPDYSIKMNMPFPQKLSNSFNIKLVTAWYQYLGLPTVPNVVWSDENHMDAYLEGYPTNSIIAINSTGIRHDATSICNWQIGYEHVIRTLKPIAIIRYGVKIPGEIESISYYKKNDNLKSCCYGW